MDPRAKRRPRRAAFLLALALCLAGPAAANEKFAGQWRLDRVDAQPPVRPVDIEMSVALDGRDVVVEGVVRRKGEEPENVSFRYVTDGEPHEVPGDEAPRLARAKWKGKELRVTFTVLREGVEVPVKERWRIKRDELVIRIVSPPPPDESRDWVVKQYYVRQ